MKSEVFGKGPWTFSFTRMTHNTEGDRVPVGAIPIGNEIASQSIYVENYDIVAEFQSGGQGFTFKATVQEFEILKD